MYTRLDKGCESEVLGVYNDRVLLKAKWTTGTTRFQNIVEVSTEYFEEKYGVQPTA